MKHPISDLLSIESVEAVVFLSGAGEVIAREYAQSLKKDMAGRDWKSFFGDDSDWDSLTQAFNGVKDAELVFENRRVYIREIDGNYLIVVMAREASTEMVRLSADTLLPELKKLKKRGFGNLFRFRN